MSDIGRFLQDGVGQKPPQIKSIQFATIPTGTGTAGVSSATINAVVPANSMIFLAGVPNVKDNSYSAIGRVYFTSPTQVSVSHSDSTLYMYQLTLLIIEFHPSAVKSRQSGSQHISAGATADITISSVTPAKCLHTAYKFAGNSGGISDNAHSNIVGLTGTNLQIKLNGSYSQTVYWEILELY